MKHCRTLPDLKLAQARLAAAAAVVRGANPAQIPEVNRECCDDRGKASHNWLPFRGSTAARLERLWAGHAEFLLGARLSGSRTARRLSAALIDRPAGGAVRVRGARLLLSTSVAAAYAGLRRPLHPADNAAETLRLREETVKLFRQRHDFRLATLASVRRWRAPHFREVELRRPVDGAFDCPTRSDLPPLLRAVPTEFWPSPCRHPLCKPTGLPRTSPPIFCSARPRHSRGALRTRPPRTTSMRRRRASTERQSARLRRP